MDDIIKRLKKHIKENYKPGDGAITSLWSEGNSDDVFCDGEKVGAVWALYGVAKIIGMEVEKPKEQDYS